MSAVAESVPADPNLGRVVKGSYRIIKPLGAGAMGVVYEGEHLALRKPVAIKTLKPEGYKSQANRERFEREAAIAAKLVHPGVTQVFDFGIDGDLPFLVMELIEGATLSDVIEREGPMPPARALSIARQLVSVLAEAHRLNLVHRDIKPENLRLLRYAPDAPPVVKVLDFGIAKEMGGTEQQAKLTATGAILGTPLYLSPEQAAGLPVDGRCDQYSAGGVLYELLSGRPPVYGTSLASILVNQISKPPPPMPSTVPEQLQKVVLRMLRKDPIERFPDEAALDKALAACESVCARAKPAPRMDPALRLSLPQPVPSASPRQRIVTLAGVLGLAVVLMVAIFSTVSKRRGLAAQHQSTTPGPAEVSPQLPPQKPAPPASPAPEPAPATDSQGRAATAAQQTPKKSRKSLRKQDNPYAVHVIR